MAAMNSSKMAIKTETSAYAEECSLLLLRSSDILLGPQKTPRSYIATHLDEHHILMMQNQDECICNVGNL